MLKTALDKNIEASVVHVIFLNLSLISIHPAKKAQIVLLLDKEVKILIQYSDFFFRKKGLSVNKNNVIELIRYQAARMLATSIYADL